MPLNACTLPCGMLHAYVRGARPALRCRPSCQMLHLAVLLTPHQDSAFMLAIG
jgi:hypothetical protein